MTMVNKCKRWSGANVDKYTILKVFLTRTLRSLLQFLTVMGVLVLGGMKPLVAADNLQQLKSACEKGDTATCVSLALLYLKGEGVKQDPIQAARLYREACEGGYPVACNNLGVMYESGTGVPRDLVRAVALFRKACDGQFEGGCFNLGLEYENGKGVKQNNTEALKYYAIACRSKLQEGCDAFARLMTGN